MKNHFRFLRTGVLLAALLAFLSLSATSATASRHIAVVADPNNFMLCNGCLKAGLPTMQAATQIFYQTHSDDFDFLFVFLTGVSSINDEGYLGGAYVTAKAPTGTGAPNPTHTPGQFGSAGRLKVVGDMYVIDNYSNNPNDVYPYFKFLENSNSAFSQVSLVGRAMMRYWGAYAQLPGGNTSLLGGNGFWNYYFHTEGSVLGGNKWREMTTNEFSASNAPRELSKIDLYLMGVTGKETVTGLYYLNNVQTTGTQRRISDPPVPGGDYIRQATRNNVNIDDIIAANGGVVAQTGPKEYRCAFILVVPFVPNGGDVEKLDKLRLRFQGWIGEQTENVITMNCRLTDDDTDGDVVDGDQPYCVDGRTRCNGPTVERCIAENWVFDETCTGRFVCIDGACVDENEDPNRDCNPGDTRCNGTVVERCDGGVWNFHQDCRPRLACYNAECVDPADIPTDGDADGDGTEVDGDDPGTDDCRVIGCPPGLRCTSAGCVECPAGTTLQGNSCVQMGDDDTDDGAGGCSHTATPTALFLFGATLLLLWRRRRA